MVHFQMQSRSVFIFHAGDMYKNRNEIGLLTLDGLQCIKVNPSWAKGYARKGAALHGQRRYVEAIETYEAGLKIEDSPAIRKGYEEVKAAKSALQFLPRLFVDATDRSLIM
jgi:tetratricopeptide (TPR) repeat protein